MKKSFKLLSSILAALTVISVSPITFSAPQNNNKTLVYKKALKYGLISAGVTAATALTAVGAYKLFSPKHEEKVIEINSEEDFEQIKNCRDTITKAIVRVETIPECAFRDCKNLKEVDLQNVVKSIETGAFFNCSKLMVVKNTSKILNVKAYAFYGCSELEEIDLSSALVIDLAFIKLDPTILRKMKKVNLPNSCFITAATKYAIATYYKGKFTYEPAFIIPMRKFNIKIPK